MDEFSKIIEALVEAEKIVENQQNYAKNSTRNRFFFIPFPHFQSLSENPTRQSDTVCIVNVIDFLPYFILQVADERHGERVQAKYKVVYYNILVS